MTTTMRPEPVDALPMPTKKVILGAGMLVATFIFGVIPVKFRHAGGSGLRRAMPFLACFSGGVFMGACLLDLFPDVQESMQHLMDELEHKYGVTIDFPVAELIIILGFLMTLTCEQFVQAQQEKQMARRRRAELAIQMGHEPVDENAPLLRHAQGGGRGQYSGQPTEAHEDEEGHGGHGGHGEHGGHGHHGAMENSSLRSILLTVALSFHSLFEGLAIGLQTEAEALYSLFMAVILHKSVMAFSLGMTIAQSVLSTKSLLISVSIFSVASPLGILIGLVISNLKASLGRDVANGVLQGLAGGTFLYITFFEVLPHEFRAPGNRLWKVLSVILGVMAIGGLIAVTG